MGRGVVRLLRTRPLTLDRIGQAFPLVQATFPEVTLDEWTHFAGAAVSRREPLPAGILTVLSELDYIAGLSIYRVEADLQHRCALVADHFFALDLFDRGAVVHALAEALEDVAREHGCVAVHTILPERVAKGRNGAGGLIATLHDLGHQVGMVRLCKRLGQSV